MTLQKKTSRQQDTGRCKRGKTPKKKNYGMDGLKGGKLKARLELSGGGGRKKEGTTKKRGLTRQKKGAGTRS